MYSIRPLSCFAGEAKEILDIKGANAASRTQRFGENAGLPLLSGLAEFIAHLSIFEIGRDFALFEARISKVLCALCKNPPQCFEQNLKRPLFLLSRPPTALGLYRDRPPSSVRSEKGPQSGVFPDPRGGSSSVDKRETIPDDVGARVTSKHIRGSQLRRFTFCPTRPPCCCHRR